MILPQEKINARYYDDQADQWIDVRLFVEPGRLSIYPMFDAPPKVIEFSNRRIKYMPLKNWFRASFGKPLICLRENVQVDKEGMTIKIHIGFPYTEPIMIQFDSMDDAVLDAIS